MTEAEAVATIIAGAVALFGGGGFALGKWKNGGATSQQAKALDEKQDALSERVDVVSARVEDHGERLGALERGQQEGNAQLQEFREEANSKLGAIAADVRALYEHATRDEDE